MQAISDLVPLFDYRTRLLTVPSGPATLFEANANRVAFLISNTNSGAEFYVTPDPSATAARGIRIPANSLPFEIYAQRHGPLARQQWFYGKTSGLTIEATLIEIFYFPDRIRPAEQFPDGIFDHDNI